MISSYLPFPQKYKGISKSSKVLWKASLEDPFFKKDLNKNMYLQEFFWFRLYYIRNKIWVSYVTFASFFILRDEF